MYLINPFLSNGIPHSYQLDLSISVLRVLGGIYHFHSNSNRTSCKQTAETLIRRAFSGVCSGSLLFAFVSQKGRLAYMGYGWDMNDHYLKFN